MLSTIIKQIVENLKYTYNTNNPFEICEQMGIPVRQRKFNPTRKAYFIALPDSPLIYVNSLFIEKSKKILCAHELGHILLGHTDVNNFDSESKKSEREANLFTLYMLFDEDDFNMKFESMSNYIIKYILDQNIKLKEQEF